MFRCIQLYTDTWICQEKTGINQEKLDKNQYNIDIKRKLLYNINKIRGVIPMVHEKNTQEPNFTQRRDYHENTH